LGQQSAGEPVRAAATAADLAISGRDYFFERCKIHKPAQSCEQYFREAFARRQAQTQGGQQ
jgi:hypothetical protein